MGRHPLLPPAGLEELPVPFLRPQLGDVVLREGDVEPHAVAVRLGVGEDAVAVEEDRLEPFGCRQRRSGRTADAPAAECEAGRGREEEGEERRDLRHLAVIRVALGLEVEDLPTWSFAESFNRVQNNGY